MRSIGSWPNLRGNVWIPDVISMTHSSVNLPVGRVLFWVAAGPHIGMGHVFRCLGLARTFETVGLQVAGFLCNEDPCSVQMIRSAGYNLWREAEAAKAGRVDVVLVDRPAGVDHSIVALRMVYAGVLVVALDSFDMEACRADLVINLINHHPTLDRPCDSRVQYYEGVEYAIIRGEFVAVRAIRDMPKKARQVVVCFGGSDPKNHTGLVLDALEQDSLPGVAVRIVIGPNFLHAGQTIARARALGFEPLERVSSLAPFFAAADLAISGGGTTMLELACTGTPTLILPQSQAETRFAESLARSSIVLVGKPDAGTAELRRFIVDLIEDQPARVRMSTLGREAIDGLGRRRIAELLLANIHRFKQEPCKSS